ncbi:NUDIX domain-containing protein [Ferrovibrio terrae]|uniref:ADP-ribose pyrophosphatase n=1 Tax=Ferrovibrio terrae TaxID=2594003 RepID=A0A516H5K0_9PROT|nr:NUDIX domain-containing protein [Ferrovibrio terrae]QDO99036.1 NUDIX domain-containing protein [Ferrovibrio terrae]
MHKPLDTSKQPYPIEIVSHERVYDRHLKVDELHLRHGLFRGGMTPVISREVVGRGDAVSVVPYDPRRDEVVLAEQFRTSALVNGDRAWMTEVVAGLIEDGESLEEVALREMKEESGLDPIGPLIFINSIYATPGFCTERYHIFCAPVDATQADGVHGVASENEEIRVFTLPFAKAYALWEAGKTPNPLVAFGLLWLALHRDKLRQTWADPRGLQP